MKLKMTPWFDAWTVRPVYVGEYEFMYRSHSYRFRAKWDGYCWTDRNGATVYPLWGDKWRGVMR